VIGRRIGTGFDGPKPMRQIVGVARDARDRGQASAPFPTVYLPFTHRTLPYTSMAVRVKTAPEPVTSAIRDRINRLNPNVPVTQFQSVRSRMEESVREPRFYTLMAVVCASMAVLFVMLGLYGLISYSVSRRRPELGIRLALGARPGSILQLVLGQALRIALSGIVLGVLLSLASSKVLSALLFEVQPNDPLTLALAVLLVLAVTLLATYGPARRAAAVDPLGVLRGD
jgi:ABC-type lipoprotein release transport system permease subunit